MSTVLINSVSVPLPSNQVYLFSESNNGMPVYKYKYAGVNGDVVGTIDESFLSILGIKPSSLPVLMYKSDFLSRLSLQYSIIEDMFVVACKPYWEILTNMQLQKADKYDFLTKIGVVDTRVASLESREIVDNSSTSINIQSLADGANYRYTQPIVGDITVSAVERGLRGSSITFRTVVSSTSPVVNQVGLYLVKWGALDAGVGDPDEYIDRYVLSLTNPNDLLINHVFRLELEGQEQPWGGHGDGGGDNYTYTCSFSDTNNRWEIYCHREFFVYDEGYTEGNVIKTRTFHFMDDNDDDVYITLIWDQDPGGWTSETTHHGEEEFGSYTGNVYGGGAGWGLFQYGDPIITCSWDDADDPYSIESDFWTTEHTVDFGHEGHHCVTFVGVEDNESTEEGEWYDASYWDELSGLVAYGNTNETILESVTWTFDNNAYDYLPGGWDDLYCIYGTRYSFNSGDDYYDSSIYTERSEIPNQPHLDFPDMTVVGSTNIVGGKSYVISVYNRMLIVAEVTPGTNGL